MKTVQEVDAEVATLRKVVIELHRAVGHLFVITEQLAKSTAPGLRPSTKDAGQAINRSRAALGGRRDG